MCMYIYYYIATGQPLPGSGFAKKVCAVRVLVCVFNADRSGLDAPDQHAETSTREVCS